MAVETGGQARNLEDAPISERRAQSLLGGQSERVNYNSWREPMCRKAAVNLARATILASSYGGRKRYFYDHKGDKNGLE